MMTFPATPLDVTVEVQYSGAWQDITADTLARQDIQITRGRSDEASRVDPSECTVQLNNRQGKYSPRNPSSPLYGLIGRNTPLRVRVGTSDVELRLPGTDGSYAYTPDAASINLTGDHDVRIELEPRSWRPGTDQILTSKWDGQRSWLLRLTTSGELQLVWSEDATLATLHTVTSTASVPVGSGQLAVRWTLDVDNGASGHDVAFYTAPSIGGTWTQLGTTVTGSGTTSVHAGTGDLEVGGANGGRPIEAGERPLLGEVHALQLLDGIGGAAVADVDFTAQTVGDREFNDAAGLTWTLRGAADIEDPSVRFTGEVVSWPSRWDVSESDVWVPIRAQGILRRLGQGASPLHSAFWRGVMDDDGLQPIAYWPCEDGKRSSSFGSVFGDHPPLTISTSDFGTVDVSLASYDGFDASEPLPEFRNGAMSTWVPEYDSSSGYLRFMMLLHAPADGISSSTGHLMQMDTTGAVNQWILKLRNDGWLRLEAYNQQNIQVVDSNWINYAVNGRQLAVWIYLIQNGSDINWQFGIFEVGAFVGSVNDGTLTGHHFGRASSIRTTSIGSWNGLAAGHVMLLNSSEFWDMADFLPAWTGETAIERMSRLSAEEGASFTSQGDDAAVMGPQLVHTYLDLMQQGHDLDLGILTERRDVLGLHYRSRETLYSQPPALELDYAQGHISPPFEPTDDDQQVRNDVTVSRVDGSSARSVETSGPLSVDSPPDGVGRYDESAEVHAETDLVLPNQASWRRHLGTVNEERYPSVRVDLARNPDLIPAVQRVREGDRITIAHTPSWLPPGPVDLIVQGYDEPISGHGYRYDLVFNCTPASPWMVGHLADVIAPLREGFEDSLLDVEITDGGSDAPWTRDSLTAHGGSWALTSGAITDGQTSDAVVTVPDGATTLDFWITHSTESGADEFVLLIDGAEISRLSGELGWTSAATQDVTGASTVTFRYTKDASGSSGLDAVWIDDLTFAFEQPQPEPDLPERADTELSRLASPVGAPSTLNTNTSFETNVNGWFYFGGTLSRSTSEAYAGSASAFCEPDGTTTNGVLGIVDGSSPMVAAGETYCWSVWVLSPTGYDRFAPAILWQDAADADLVEVEGDEVAVPADVWTEVVMVATAPDTATEALPRLRTKGTPTASDVFYVDQARFSDESAVQVATYRGPRWITTAAHPGDFPCDVRVGGEVMRMWGVVDALTDTFSRTVADGWGRADSGQSWTVTGDTTDYSVDGSSGLVAVDAVGESRTCTVAIDSDTVDITATVSTDALASGAPLLAALIARYQDADNHYAARLDFNTDQSMTINLLKLVGGTETNIGSVATGLTHAAGTQYSLRMWVQDETDRIKVKAWETSAGEPDGWDVVTTDSDLSLPDDTGLYSRVASGSTNTLPVTFTWDDVTVTNPQRFEVQRSVNDVTKSQLRYTDVRLAQPMIIQL